MTIKQETDDDCICGHPMKKHSFIGCFCNICRCEHYVKTLEKIICFRCKREIQSGWKLGVDLFCSMNCLRKYVDDTISYSKEEFNNKEEACKDSSVVDAQISLQRI
jgi:hypothetical protein